MFGVKGCKDTQKNHPDNSQPVERLFLADKIRLSVYKMAGHNQNQRVLRWHIASFCFLCTVFINP
jgi:hypothetical protein